MINITSPQEGFQVFRAMGSQARVSILELLLEKGPMSMTAIAQEMGITGGALTSHIKLLHEAGIIDIEKRGGKHGVQKVCRVNKIRINVAFKPKSRA